jgi:hypothetical protein
MELRETIESINEKLIREYGIDISLNMPNWRVVFSEDQYEKRLTNFTDEGFELLFPEVRELPKYKQHIRAKYILEHLVPVTEGIETDLVTKVSFEPSWVFQDKNGNYLPPFFEGCQHVIESVLAATGNPKAFAKYKDETISVEARAAHLKKVEDELFGNESDLGDHLAYKTGIVVPGNDTVQ